MRFKIQKLEIPNKSVAIAAFLKPSGSSFIIAFFSLISFRRNASVGRSARYSLVKIMIILTNKRMKTMIKWDPGDRHQ